MVDHESDTTVYLDEIGYADSLFVSQRTPVTVEASGVTDVGRVRSENQDHFGIFELHREMNLIASSLPAEQLNLPSDCSWALIVADGIGGMQSGELASRLALQTVTSLAREAYSWIMKLRDRVTQKVDDRVQAYVSRVQSVLESRRKSDPEIEQMGTTWTSVHVVGWTAIVVHLGDSRAYLYRDGQLRQITKDQTLAQLFIDFGSRSENVEQFKHLLLNNLGSNSNETRAVVYQVDLEPEDRLVVCTDGLTDMISDDELKANLDVNHQPNAACQALLATALENGGEDNITVVVANIDESEQPDCHD